MTRPALRIKCLHGGFPHQGYGQGLGVGQYLCGDISHDYSYQIKADTEAKGNNDIVHLFPGKFSSLGLSLGSETKNRRRRSELTNVKSKFLG